MTRPDLMSAAAAERADLLALLSSLTTAQWEAPSLCLGWSVKDVATHVVSYDELGTRASAMCFLRGGLRPAKINEVALARYQTLSHAQVLDMVSRNQRPRGLTAGFRGGIGLTDSTIHHQDIRRAVGRPRTIPEERLRVVLDFSLKAPTLPSRSNRRGLRLVATDIEWSSGEGPELTGPGEALLMAVAGRADALGEVDGDGAPLLRSRVLA